MDGTDLQVPVPAPAWTGPRRWVWLRGVAAAAILSALLWHLGTGPFVVGLTQVDVRSLVVGTALAVVTTLCCAWRWTLVSRALGATVPLHTAVAACYRSQFINLATPGGVVGDVDRALRHGRAVGDASRGLRSVVWERMIGQLVLVGVAGTALVLLPSPIRDAARVTVLAGTLTVLACGAAAIVLCRSTRASTDPSSDASSSSSRPPARTPAVGRAVVDLRAVGLTRNTWSRILLASLVAVSCHVLTFFVAARTAGAGGEALSVLPLALVVLLAMGLPNVAGWGPREGVAAWAFGAGGLGAQQGVTTAVVYGVMVFVGALPGALLMLVAGTRRLRRGTGG